MQNQYTFKTQHDRIITVTDFNTRITYETSDGRVAVWPTVKNIWKHWLWRKTRTVRHYAGLIALSRRYSVR